MNKMSLLAIFIAIAMLAIPFSTSVQASPAFDVADKIEDGFGILASSNREINAIVDSEFSILAQQNTEIHSDINDWIAPYAEGNHEIHVWIDDHFGILAERNTEIHEVIQYKLMKLGEFNNMREIQITDWAMKALDRGVAVEDILAQIDQWIGILIDHSTEIHSQITDMMELLAEYNNEIHSIIIIHVANVLDIDPPEWFDASVDDGTWNFVSQWSDATGHFDLWNGP